MWLGYIFYVISFEFAKFYYYCSLTVDDIINLNTEKFTEFVDANDFITSFLFNILEETY